MARVAADDEGRPLAFGVRLSGVNKNGRPSEPKRIHVRKTDYSYSDAQSNTIKHARVTKLLSLQTGKCSDYCSDDLPGCQLRAQRDAGM